MESRFNLAVAVTAGAMFTVVAIGYLPWIIHVAGSKHLGTWRFSPSAVAIVLAGVWATAQYWLFFLHTVKGRALQRGPMFYLGVLCGVLVSLLLLAVSSVGFLLTVPAWATGVHLCRVQDGMQEAMAR